MSYWCFVESDKGLSTILKEGDGIKHSKVGFSISSIGDKDGPQ